MKILTKISELSMIYYIMSMIAAILTAYIYLDNQFAKQEEFKKIVKKIDLIEKDYCKKDRLKKFENEINSQIKKQFQSSHKRIKILEIPDKLKKINNEKLKNRKLIRRLKSTQTNSTQKDKKGNIIIQSENQALKKLEIKEKLLKEQEAALLKQQVLHEF
ncbi:MAG: hypothetical protein B6I26_04840 [Desulfobacteraceae bacterium 4572_130]|nr:MAG: hypothetical protein B6I26_04840 [Desulfobacteraceae bacterium 4572_130]